MSEFSLVVTNLGKCYRSYESELYRFANWFGFASSKYQDQWVCRNINFNLPKGEAIGIVGRNGAGKSTLLKIISGVLSPSEGNVQHGGRVSAILELGLGFNDNFSGRRNVYHAGGLMGFSVSQIDGFIDDIETFIELGDYFDSPMRSYSSGMKMRVAFAVATMSRPDVLIVDEALSVGDAYFQHKCFGRIKAFQERGTSLLFVSHDQQSIQTLCQRALLLDKGVVVDIGKPSKIFDHYNALITDQQDEVSIDISEIESSEFQVISGTGQAKLTSTLLRNEKGERVDVVSVGEEVILEADVLIVADIRSLVLGFMIRDRVGNVIFGTNTYHLKEVVTNPVQGNVYRFLARFPANLGVGNYSISIAATSGETHLEGNYEWRDLAVLFDVVNNAKNSFVGTSWIDTNIEVQTK